MMATFHAESFPDTFMLFAISASSSKWPEIFTVISRVAGLRRSHSLHVTLQVPQALVRESLRLRVAHSLEDCLDVIDAQTELPDGVQPMTASSFIEKEF